MGKILIILMKPEGIFVLLLLVLMLFLLIRDKLRPGIVLFSILTILMVTGIVTTQEAIAGFSNEGMITVFILFFVSEGIRQTGALNRFIRVMLPKKKGLLPVLLFKMMLPVSLLSSVLNNTPIVVIFAPMIKKWAEKLRLPSSKFLIPLSYATIFGGMCTLIGTSTNLVVHGLMLENGLRGLTMFELGKIGIFVVILGTLYVSLLGGPFLLPGKRKSRNNYITENKKYYYNIIIPVNSQFIGKKVINGHFPDHRDIFVTLIYREENSIIATSGETVLKANDKLVIMGEENILEQLITITGISLEDYENIDNEFRYKKLVTIEVVVADSSPVIGQTLRDFNFYGHYGGIVAAINRNGEKITTHTGNVELKSGDCLVILAGSEFIERWQGRRDFYLLSDKGVVDLPQSKTRILFAIGLAVLMVIGAVFSYKFPALYGNKIDMLYLAACVATIMFWTKVVASKNYTSAVNWDVLITIACSFGISRGVQNSGLADNLASSFINTARDIGPVTVLACVYLITNLFTEIITNNAAAAIMFPISLSASHQMHVNPLPFCVAICIAASASFSTPIGYQTNLIVQGIGEYKFKDFLKIGLPLNLIIMILSIILIPIFWSF
jgi:di/tricarboxylate transporter